MGARVEFGQLMRTNRLSGRMVFEDLALDVRQDRHGEYFLISRAQASTTELVVLDGFSREIVTCSLSRRAGVYFRRGEGPFHYGDHLLRRFLGRANKIGALGAARQQFFGGDQGRGAVRTDRRQYPSGAADQTCTINCTRAGAVRTCSSRRFAAMAGEPRAFVLSAARPQTSRPQTRWKLVGTAA